LPEQLTAFGGSFVSSKVTVKSHSIETAAARADNKGKRTLTAKMLRSSAIISVYMPSDHATMSGNVTPRLRGCKFAFKREPFFDHC